MQDSKTRVRIWHITKFFRNAKLGRCRGTAEIEQAAPFQFGRSYRLALSFCMSMISGQTLRVCPEGKPVPTPHQVRGRLFPDHMDRGPSAPYSLGS
jgi:hypothetical protein